MRTVTFAGERYVSFEAYKRTTTSLKRQLAQAQLELERAQNRSRNLRNAIKGLERAVNKLKAGGLTNSLEIFARMLATRNAA